MAGDVGVGPFLPGEACGRDVDGGFLELLLGDRVVGPNVLEAELRDGEVEGLVLRPSRIPSEVEGLDGRYRTRCSGARGFGPARLRTLLIPSLVFSGVFSRSLSESTSSGRTAFTVFPSLSPSAWPPAVV